MPDTAPIAPEPHRFSIRLPLALRNLPWIGRKTAGRICRWVVAIHTLVLGAFVALSWNGSNELLPNWIFVFWVLDFPSSWLVLSIFPVSWVVDAVTSKIVMTPLFLVGGAVQWSMFVLSIVQLDRIARNPPGDIIPTMELLGDEIQQILHSGGSLEGKVTVDRYVIVLRSGRCVELTADGARSARPTKLIPDATFASSIGNRVEAVVVSDEWSTPGLKLSNGKVLVMGSPHPYYWGLESRDAV